MTPRPLVGRRVIDLSQYIAGPSCAQLLADFGAEVIKVEPPAGDPARMLGQSRFGSVFFRQFNTGKRSVLLNLADDSGRAQLDELLEGADALVMNFAARTREKLGLDWESLHLQHPQLTVVSISAYGDDDPRTALDSVVQAGSGYAAINTGEHGEPRIAAGYPTDIYSGLYGGISAAMAILDPELTEGVFIDVPMIEVAMVALTGSALLATAGGDEPRTGRGNRDAATVPSSVFPCSDGDVYIYAGLDKHWELLRQLVDGPTGSTAERLANPDPYEQAVIDWTSQRTIDEVLTVIEDLGIAISRVSSPMQALNELHRTRPGAVIDFDTDGAPVPQFPVTFSGERIARQAAPRKETQ